MNQQEWDTDKIDDMALAILALTLGDDGRAWKSLDWEVSDRLYEKGYIEDPKNKNKSVAFKDKGIERARLLQAELFKKD